MQVYGFGGVPEKVVPSKPEENAPRLKQVAKAGSDKTEADDNTG